MLQQARGIRQVMMGSLLFAVFIASASGVTPEEAMLGRMNDRVLVRPYRSPLAGQAIRELSARAKVGAWVEKKFPALGGLQIIALPRGVGPERAIAALRATGVYEFVEPDYIVHASAMPNDPGFSSQWGLHNTGQSGGVADADIDAPEGWDSAIDASGVILAVIDTGVRYTHEDLAANMWTNPGESGGGKETNGLDDDGNGYIDDVHGINAITGTGNPMDDAGHGTHVAGTAGAVGNNGVGVTGVAWSAKIMACKFLASNGNGSVSDAIKCIDYARAHGARVLNNSWGGGGFSQALLDAISAAGQSGAIFVAAAGNDSSNNAATPSYPASYLAENVIAIAGTARTDALYSSTNYGFGVVDLAAPGQEIYSTYGSADNAYAWMSGTSMATPHASGLAALLCARFPSDSPRQTINRMLRSTEPVAALAGKATIAGRSNLALALASTTTAPFNDAFADACTIPVFPATIRTSNQSATSEPGEPSHAGAAPANTLWWKWTAPSTGEVLLNTKGSGFDTLLAVYTGTSISSLTQVAANDDAATSTTSSLTFQAAAGTIYYFAVGGKSSTGLVVLNLAAVSAPQPPPANDHFADRQSLAGEANLVVATNASATFESGEPLNTSESGAHSVWWEWTAPRAGRMEIVTDGSDFDTTLGVYTGTAVNALVPVDQNDDVIGGFVRTSRVLFDAQAGQKYQISVDGWDVETGGIYLWLTLGDAPSNDNFANAAMFPALSVSATGGNASATSATFWANHEPGEPNHDASDGISSVWWTWTAPASGNVTVNADNSDFYTVLGVYQGTTVGSLSLIGSDAVDSVQSHVAFGAVAGQTYRIAVDGIERSAGNASLQLALQNARPSVSSASVSPAGAAFDDQALTLASVTASDPEGDSLTLARQWQSSPDGVTYTDAIGETSATLPPDPARSGKFWRCRISASDILGAGSPIFTAAVALDNHPPAIARDGQFFSYDCDLPGTADFILLPGSELPAGLTLSPSTGELSGTLLSPGGGLFHVRIGRGALERAFDLLVGTVDDVYRVPAGKTWTPPGPVSITGILIVEGSLASGSDVTVTESYSAWRAANFGAPGAPGANDDSDGDGRNDFTEFAFGGNPLLPDSAAFVPAVGTDAGRATITFRRQKAPAQVAYVVERSSDLVNWTPVDPATNAVAPPSPDGLDFEILTVRDIAPIASTPSFLRIRAALLP